MGDMSAQYTVYTATLVAQKDSPVDGGPCWICAHIYNKNNEMESEDIIALPSLTRCAAVSADMLSAHPGFSSQSYPTSTRSKTRLSPLCRFTVLGNSGMQAGCGLYRGAN